MRQIGLTQGKVAFVDDEDYERVNQFKWHAHKSGNIFYAERTVAINGKRTNQQMHVFIMGETHGKPYIDHKNGDGLHNWRLNMRPCNNQENQMNREPNKNSSSKYKGVSWHKKGKKWIAQIQVKGKKKHLGSFEIEKDAALAYDAEAYKRDPEFARLNFPK